MYVGFSTSLLILTDKAHKGQEADVYYQGFGGRSVHYASGKTLGGGSARNFLWYMRSVEYPGNHPPLS